jgi:hypothetical protein
MNFSVSVKDIGDLSDYVLTLCQPGYKPDI